MWVSIILIALAVAMFIESRLSSRRRTAGNAGAATASTSDAPAPFQPRPLLAAATTLMFIAFIGVLDLKLLSFAVAAPLFLVCTGLMIGRGERKIVPWIVASALVFGLGAYYAFTHFFYVDLP